MGPTSGERWRPGAGTAREAAGAGPAELAERLAGAFAAPVGLVEPVRGRWLACVGARPERFPDPAACPVVGGSERVLTWRPNGADGPAWLVLAVGGPGGREWAALVGFAGRPGAGGPWGPPCPDAALRSWGQTVLDQLPTAQAAPPAPPDDGRVAALVGRLTRRLRVSDPPERFQRVAMNAARGVLGVAALAWVPGATREPIVFAGDLGGLGAEDFRAWVPPDARGRPAAGADPARVAVVADDADQPAGWLVAVGPPPGRPFGPAEAERLRPLAALVGSQRHNARLYSDVRDLLFGVVRALTSAIDAKDPYTSGHSERVARIAVRLGQELGLSSHQRSDLYLMGLLHDVGKIGIEDDLLQKAGGLTAEEYRRIQSHVRIGIQILSDLKALRHLLPGVAHHHECVDGSGYPDGLAGDQIPLLARILAVADAYDAMSSTRPYRRSLNAEQIDAILRNGAGTQWDPRVIAALFACRDDLEHVRHKGLGESLQRVVADAVGRN